MPRTFKLRRNVRGGPLPSIPSGNVTSKSDTSSAIEQSHARQIANLPPDQLSWLIRGLREGASPQTIAHFFGEQGWLTVTEKSFKAYVAAFRRVYPERIRGSGATDDDNDLNHFIEPRQAGLDPELTLNQLIRLQTTRLAIGHKMERNMGFYNKDLHRDTEVTLKLLESLNNMRGGGAKTKSGAASMVMSNEASEELRKADQAESAQDRLIHLTSQLAPLVKQKINGS